MSQSSFAKSAATYDVLNDWKDYAGEVAKLRSFIASCKRSPGSRLLDVACGTGKHLELLRTDSEVEGLDAQPEMLALARQRCPGVPFHQGDMRSFNLGRQFDVVTCLFSAIGYCSSVEGLHQSIGTMRRHLVAGGVLLVEPFIDPAEWQDGYVTAKFADLPDLKVARMNTSRSEGRLAVLDFHFLVGTPDGVEHFTEVHRLALFTRDEFEHAFRAAGLHVTFDPEGLMGRGLYIGSS
ncbi:MAG: class I SAM-dependent methyltransferase [Chloroflexota bacterium]|nr:class I SAM-dependent methyltransferase [Chloroflexota bacterium]